MEVKTVKKRFEKVDYYVESTKVQDLCKSVLLKEIKTSQQNITFHRFICAPIQNQVIKSLEKLVLKSELRQKHINTSDNDFFREEKIRSMEKNRTCYRKGTKIEFRSKNKEEDGSSLLKPKKFQDAVPLVLNHHLAKQNQSVTDFYGPTPCSIMKEDIPKLHHYETFYVVAAKTNGIRFLMVACTFFGSKFVFLVNRSNEFYLVSMKNVPESVFDGTVFDGELVHCFDGTFKFIVFDCWMSCGMTCAEYNYIVRLQIASLLLEKWVHFEQGLSVQVKKVYAYPQILDLLLEMKTGMDHQTDGLIFTPVETVVKPGQNSGIFKFKEGSKNTIDFIAVNKENGLIDLFCANDKYWATTHWKHQSSNFHPLMIEKKIVECRFSQEQKTWIIECIRLDKNKPNVYGIAEKTWKNIVENLKLKDLFPSTTLPEEVKSVVEKIDFLPISSSHSYQKKEIQLTKKNVEDRTFLAPLPSACL